MWTTTFRIVVAILALAVCALLLACGARSLGHDDHPAPGDAIEGGDPVNKDGSQTSPGIAADGGVDDGAEPDAGAEATADAAREPDAWTEADAAREADARSEADVNSDLDARVEADAARYSRVPAHHRPNDSQCSAPAPSGDCSSPGPLPGGCTSDSMCAASTIGRCINPGGGVAADCFCTYDICVHDTDCPGGQTCACHGSPYTDGRGNACVEGNCRVDADCGAGGYCSPSSFTFICGDYLAGYYCHTAEDLCVDDSDCPGSASNPGIPGCVYSTTDLRWECGQLLVCL